MKNFISKSLVMALTVLPLLSHAQTKDCGGGYIKQIISGVGNESYRYELAIIDWSTQYPPNTEASGGVPLHTGNPARDRLRSTALSAFHAGSFIRFGVDSGGGNHCYNSNKIMICKSESTCNGVF